jgi:hypothetical protein
MIPEKAPPSCKSYAVFIYIVAIMISGCHEGGFVIFQPTLTLTPTQAPTSLPTSTITPTATSAPTATIPTQPDYQSVVLTSGDVPAEFVFMPRTDEEGMKSFGFVLQGKEFVLISGASLLLSDVGVFRFDDMIQNPDQIISMASGALQNTQFSDIQTIQGMNGYGELSNGISSRTTIDGKPYFADFFTLRKGNIGTLVMYLYRSGSKPPLSIRQIASILDQKIDKAIK